MNYISGIKINELRNLKNLDIKLDTNKPVNLIITGKNGSGKTTLLNAIFENLLMLTKEFRNIESEKDEIINYKFEIEKNGNIRYDIEALKAELRELEEKYAKCWGKIELSIPDYASFYNSVKEGKFLLAYYRDNRVPEFKLVNSPAKPDFSITNWEENKLSQFLNMLVDYKIQAALASNEGNNADAEYIKGWFDEFERMLQQLFEDDNLKLEFNYSNYTFTINTGGKSFMFTQMSAGYNAALDIIADLVFKMQHEDKIVRAYDMAGIVLIDEIETHLHLELQKKILPLLTTFFPNIQFIVTTHSPFVLNSHKNTVAYDLEHQESITDLTEYSFDSLAEGYFGVKPESAELECRFDRFKQLAEKDTPSQAEKEEFKRMREDFEKISDAIAPNIKIRYKEILNRYLAKEDAE